MAQADKSVPKFQPPTTKENHCPLVITQLSTGYQTGLPKQAATACTPTGGKMTKDTKSPWLIAAITISEELKKEPPEVQAEIRRLSKKTYPKTWKEIQRQEQDSREGQE